MTNRLFVVGAIFICLSFGANAQMIKCKGPDGKVQFSDRPLVCYGKSEIVRDRGSFVSERDKIASQQRTERMRGEIDAQENERVAAIEAARAEQRRNDASSERTAAAAKMASDDSDAYANCVRDVERRGASQRVKAEMIAACRTSGQVQRSTGISGEAVSNCVKNVERTGASEKEKARQLAICHGGDVRPEPVQIAQPPTPQPAPAFVGGCFNGKCSDQYGNSYRKDVSGNFVRSDGSRCRAHGSTLVCD